MYKPVQSISDVINEQKELLTSSLDASLSGIVITHFELADNPVIYCNKAFEELTGYSEKEILGKNCRFLQSADRTQSGRYKLQNAITQGKECHVELVNYRKDGTMFWNQLHVAPIHNNEGVLTHYIGMQNDISLRKLKGLVLKTENNRSSQLQHLKNEFINAAGHELKTPLTSLKATLQLFSRIMDKDLNDTKQQLLLNKANINLNKLSSLIEDLLNVDSVESGRLLHHYSKFSFLELIEEAIENLGFDSKHNIRIIGNKQLEVIADKDRIEQVIINLLNNAVKYSPFNKVIEVTLENTAIDAIVTIKDFGIGIPSHKLLHIFERYYRGNHSQLQVSGLGLGLFIANEIIKNHDGKIYVESIEGEGSTFCFKIPLNNPVIKYNQA